MYLTSFDLPPNPGGCGDGSGYSNPHLTNKETGSKLGVIVHACNLSTRKAEAGASLAPGQPWLQGNTVSN
jgi:hypothetical protein